MKNRTMSGSGLFLIELMLAILIFAIAAAICLRIFVTANHISTESTTLNHAVIAAQSGAECFKATMGDLHEMSELLGGVFFTLPTIELTADGRDKLVFSFDYVLEITRGHSQNGLIEGDVSVSDRAGQLIFSIPVIVKEVTP